MDWVWFWIHGGLLIVSIGGLLALGAPGWALALAGLTTVETSILLHVLAMLRRRMP